MLLTTNLWSAFLSSCSVKTLHLNYRTTQATQGRAQQNGGKSAGFRDALVDPAAEAVQRVTGSQPKITTTVLRLPLCKFSSEKVIRPTRLSSVR